MRLRPVSSQRVRVNDARQALKLLVSQHHAQYTPTEVVRILTAAGHSNSIVRTAINVSLSMQEVYLNGERKLVSNEPVLRNETW